MSMILNFFGRRRNNNELSAWDTFDGWSRPMFPPGFPAETASFVRAAVERRETPAAYVFTAEVPGLRKEEVKVTVEEGGVLHISGERRRHREDTADGWHRMESSSGSFSRRFRLPENAKVDRLRASMEGGVLTVTVPKADPHRRANARSIEISDYN
ncbi:hypothetical protein TIFTF001_010602 [Ficus carica]|uniref:SHSP domain-containing protein n=1 Tax=Ficus carica TaxID=3494 RepID=A0AA87ZY02_FICCA|nr:hypothetical protein TIFTF001_010602 [Ficus carica]